MLPLASSAITVTSLHSDQRAQLYVTPELLEQQKSAALVGFVPCDSTLVAEISTPHAEVIGGVRRHCAIWRRD